MHNVLVTLVLCCLLYSSTAPLESFVLSVIVTLTLVVLIEVFILCWFCQEFTTEFSNVLDAAYELDWLNYSPKLRRTIILTIMRLQKPPFFTMAKSTRLDMIFFSNLLKMAYSFYTLISKVN
uniref:Odorant receptor OR39 n=1 Tax=Colaphellus bowringi TaxID=561076 RepID=A0A0S3J3H4_9CUCU|nr:odorant receptor OR39 [Colaphellus bowringi]